MLDIRIIPVLSDNYVYLLHEPDSRMTAVVDPGEAAPVLAEADRLGWTITHILVTHHHGDHIGGNHEIREASGCRIVGPYADRDRIPDLDILLREGEQFTLGREIAKIFEVPGHTSGHIAYWFDNAEALFCGDSLFSLGCGRLFEGTPAQMWHSLQKLRELPDRTQIYCGHEYTQSNARFALSIDPDNVDLQARAKQIETMRSRGEPTLPATLGEEKRINPFLRADAADLAEILQLSGSDPVQVFTEIRSRKDNF